MKIVMIFRKLATFFSIIFTENKLSRVSCKSIESFIILKTLIKHALRKDISENLQALKFMLRSATIGWAIRQLPKFCHRLLLCHMLLDRLYNAG